jgi:hypothetical protein
MYGGHQRTVREYRFQRWNVNRRAPSRPGATTLTSTEFEADRSSSLPPNSIRSKTSTSHKSRTTRNTFGSVQCSAQCSTTVAQGPRAQERTFSEIRLRLSDVEDVGAVYRSTTLCQRRRPSVSRRSQSRRRSFSRASTIDDVPDKPTWRISRASIRSWPRRIS